MISPKAVLNQCEEESFIPDAESRVYTCKEIHKTIYGLKDNASFVPEQEENFENSERFIIKSNNQPECSSQVGANHFDRYFSLDTKYHMESQDWCKLSRTINQQRTGKSIATHKTYRSTLNGRKNMSKFFGLQLKKYFEKNSSFLPVATNKSIKTFNERKNHSKQWFKELVKDFYARQIVTQFLKGEFPIINTLKSRKINDKRWSIKSIIYYLKMLEKVEFWQKEGF